MKKLISLSLVLIILFTGLIPAAGVTQNAVEPVLSELAQKMAPVNMAALEKTQNFDHLFQPATSVWHDIAGSVFPAGFQNVSYTLNDNVVHVDSTVVKDIQSATQVLNNAANDTLAPMTILSEGAFIDKSVLNSAASVSSVKPGTVFFDQSTNTAFKLVTPIIGGETSQNFDNKYSLIKPQIHEIVKDFTLPQQTVHLNRANITGFADPQIEAAAKATMAASQISSANNLVFTNMPFVNSKYSVLQLNNFNEFKFLQNPLIKIVFPKDTKLKGYLGNGYEVVVTLNGGLGIGDIQLDGRYTSFDGYDFGLSVSQEAYLQVSVAISIQQEVRIPILGIDVPFGIGRVTGGLFLVVNIDGNITIEIQAREWTRTTVGVGGGTFLYVPTSVGPSFDMPEKGITGDVSIDGKINGTIKAGALLEVEILGWDLVGAGAFIGAGINVATDGTYLDVELYGLVQVYIAFLGDQYNLIDFKIDVFRRKQKDMGGYRVLITEADAYMKRVCGTIQYDYGQGGKQPEPNVPYQVRVYLGGVGDPVIYKPADPEQYYYTDQYGEFIVYGVELTIYDKVEIVLVDKNDPSGNTLRASEPGSTSYPFKNITINDADYFNDFIVGQVTPVQVKNWGVHTGVLEDETYTLYYKGPVTINLNEGGNYSYTTKQTVLVQTDEFGSFRADGDKQLTIDNQEINVKPITFYGLSFKQYGFLVTDISHTKAKVEFQLKRVVDLIAGSATSFNEGAKKVDQIAYNERYYIINMRGTRQVEAKNVKYKVCGFSTQDKYKKHFIHLSYPYSLGDPVVDVAMEDDALMGLYPTTFSLLLNADSTAGEANGTSFLNNKVILQWVWQANPNAVATTAPATAATAKTASSTATSTAVITSSPLENTASPTTAATTPAMTASPTVSPTAAQSAPLISSSDHASMSMTGGTFQVTATGKAPITYSLTSSSPIGGVPSQITINADTGLITVIRGLSAGDYKFYINTANGVSPDAKQLFTLTLQPLSTLLFQDAGKRLAVINSRFLAAHLMDLVVKPGATKTLKQNVITLRNDDVKDAYTTDQNYLSGTEYIKWDGIITISIEGESDYHIYYDNSPTTDHHKKPLTQEETIALKDAYDELVKVGYNSAKGFKLDDGLAIRLADELSTAKVLNYGDILNGIGKLTKESGPYEVHLGGNAGTFIPGDVFNGLKKKSGAKVKLVLDGAEVLYAGDAIGRVKDSDLYDFGYYPYAPDEDLMRAKVPDDPKAFTYSFAHNGKLPGYGQFSIATGMQEGEVVNVYKYDPETTKYIYIAGKVKVDAGGVVHYKNNMTSEYIITAKTIAGAAKAPSFVRQGPGIYLPDQWWFWLIVGLLVLTLGGGAAWVIMRKRKIAVK